eukprot:gene4855-5323_t
MFLLVQALTATRATHSLVPLTPPQPYLFAVFLVLKSILGAVYRVGDKSIVGCYGLDADGELIMELLRGKVCNHLQSEVAAPAVARLLSNLLYEKSFYITPVIAGFELDGRPYLCSMDSLGAMTASRSFAVTGSATTQLHALCEALYVPDLDALQLVKLTERCLRLAFQRDILSGGDLKVVILTRDGLFVKEISFQDI